MAGWLAVWVDRGWLAGCVGGQMDIRGQRTLWTENGMDGGQHGQRRVWTEESVDGGKCGRRRSAARRTCAPAHSPVGAPTLARPFGCLAAQKRRPLQSRRPRCRSTAGGMYATPCATAVPAMASGREAFHRGRCLGGRHHAWSPSVCLAPCLVPNHVLGTMPGPQACAWHHAWSPTVCLASPPSILTLAWRSQAGAKFPAQNS
eukprot:7718-Chlamydomonas_euryale.AAC.2